jgi:hypothetical protein
MVDGPGDPASGHGAPFAVQFDNGLRWFKGDGRSYQVYESYLPSPDVPGSSDVVIAISDGPTGGVFVRSTSSG